jgi:hypothetical protein
MWAASDERGDRFFPCTTGIEPGVGRPTAFFDHRQRGIGVATLVLHENVAGELSSESADAVQSALWPRGSIYALKPHKEIHRTMPGGLLGGPDLRSESVFERKRQ